MDGESLLVERSFIEALVCKLRDEDVDKEEEPDCSEDSEHEDDGGDAAGEKSAGAASRGRLFALKRLWDLSVSESICALLSELSIVPVIEHVLVAPNSSPRVQEMCLGVLGNCASGCSQFEEAIVKSAALVRRLAELLMTSPHPAPLRELMRLLAVLVAQRKQLGPEDDLVALIVDDVLLNQTLCILFNTLDPELVTRTAAFLNCLIYYYPRLVDVLVRLGTISITCGLLSSPSDLAPSAVSELLRLLQALSCHDEAAELIRAEAESGHVLLSLLIDLSDDTDALAACEILENVFALSLSTPETAHTHRVAEMTVTQVTAHPSSRDLSSRSLQAYVSPLSPALLERLFLLLDSLARTQHGDDDASWYAENAASWLLRFGNSIRLTPSRLNPKP
jgi:hypothetical protein